MRRRMLRSQELFHVTARKDGRGFLISGFGPPLRNGGLDSANGAAGVEPAKAVTAMGISPSDQVKVIRCEPDNGA